MGGGASAQLSKATDEELKAVAAGLSDADKAKLRAALADSAAATKVVTPKERVEMAFSKIADADGYVKVEGMTRVMMCMGASKEDAQREAGGILGPEGRMLPSELAAGEVGQFLGSGDHESTTKLRQLESAAYGGDRVSDAQFVDATAFATADGDECTKLLKEKVMALCKAVGADGTTGFTKDQLLKYALGLAQSGALAAMDFPAEASEFMREVVNRLFTDLDESCDGKVTQEEAFNYAVKTLLGMAGCSSIAAMPQEMKMQLMMAVAMYCDLMLGAGSATGSERLAEVTKMLKAAFDSADLNGNGFLDRDELKAGCLVMAKGISEMSGGEQSAGQMAAEMEGMLDGFIEQADKEKTGQIRFEDMLAVALPALCEGEEPEKFLTEMDPTMFTTIKMQIEMFLGGFLKK